MLKISNYFNMKEAWEGLQRAGNTRNSSGLGSLKYLMKYYQNGVALLFDYNSTNIRFLLRLEQILCLQQTFSIKFLK